MGPKKKQMVFYCFMVQWTVRARAIFGYVDGGFFFFKEKKARRLSGKGLSVRAAVSDSTTKAGVIVCAVRQHENKKTPCGDVFGLCADQLIGVSLTKELLQVSLLFLPFYIFKLLLYRVCMQRTRKNGT